MTRIEAITKLLILFGALLTEFNEKLQCIFFYLLFHGIGNVKELHHFEFNDQFVWDSHNFQQMTLLEFECKLWKSS